MKTKLKKLKDDYDSPTPVPFRRIGDGLLLVSGLVTLFIPGAKWAIAIGMIGKYISNFAKNK
jgi:hypothetical protein